VSFAFTKVWNGVPEAPPAGAPTSSSTVGLPGFFAALSPGDQQISLVSGPGPCVVQVFRWTVTTPLYRGVPSGPPSSSWTAAGALSIEVGGVSPEFGGNGSGCASALSYAATPGRLVPQPLPQTSLVLAVPAQPPQDASIATGAVYFALLSGPPGTYTFGSGSS
jgi:hypothetical protein